MNSEKEIKGAARLIRQLETYIKDLEKQKGATIKAKAKAVALPEKRKKAYTSIIFTLANWDKHLNEPKQADRYAKLPKPLAPKISNEKIKVITHEHKLKFAKDHY